MIFPSAAPRSEEFIPQACERNKNSLAAFSAEGQRPIATDGYCRVCKNSYSGQRRWRQKPEASWLFATGNLDHIMTTLSRPDLSDIRRGDWVDRRLPIAWRPYARLARLD